MLQVEQEIIGAHLPFSSEVYHHYTQAWRPSLDEAFASFLLKYYRSPLPLKDNKQWVRGPKYITAAKQKKKTKYQEA